MTNNIKYVSQTYLSFHSILNFVKVSFGIYKYNVYGGSNAKAVPSRSSIKPEKKSIMYIPIYIFVFYYKYIK